MDFTTWFPGGRLIIGGLLMLSANLGHSATFHALMGGEDPSTNRIRVVFLSEGYTEAQLSKFLTDARNSLENLLAQVPFNEYRSLFTAHAIAVGSAQAGSDHPASGISRSTYFNSSFDADDRVITIPLGADGQGKVDALVETFLPEADLKILLVNDAVSGGSDGFGHTVIASASSGSMDMLVHETGHVLGDLDDEYEFGSPVPGDVEHPNTTRETRREHIKWKAWIAAETPIPTPPSFDFIDVVGLFEGAHYESTGWYRPELDCKMRSLAVPFCDVCSEALVLGIYDVVRPVERYTPAVASLNVEPGGTTSFSIQTIQPANHEIQVQWLTNGVLAAEDITNLVLAASALIPGINTVVAEVVDATPLVRNDPAGRLSQTVVWSVAVDHPGAGLVLQEPVPLPEGLAFRVSGEANQRYILQRSVDLATWTPVTTNTLAPGGDWHTNQFPEFQNGFYRAQSLP